MNTVKPKATNLREARHPSRQGAAGDMRELTRGTIFPTKILKVGDKWGKLECVAYEHLFVTFRLSTAVQETREVILRELRCQGGELGGVDCRGAFWVMVDDDPPAYLLKEWPILYQKQFPGKRVMKDCGCMSRARLNPGGEGAGEEYPSLSISFSMSMPTFLHLRLKNLAEARMEKQSEIVREMMVRGLNALEPPTNERLDGRWPDRGTLRDNVVTWINDTLMKRLTDKAREINLPVRTVAMALMDLGLELVERERDEVMARLKERTGVELRDYGSGFPSGYKHGR